MFFKCVTDVHILPLILRPVFSRPQLSGAEGVVSCVGGFGSNEQMEKLCGDATVLATEAAEKVWYYSLRVSCLRWRLQVVTPVGFFSNRPPVIKRGLRSLRMSLSEDDVVSTTRGRTAAAAAAARVLFIFVAHRLAL